MLDIAHINFAGENPHELATFWQQVLGGERLDLPDSVDLEIVERPDGQSLMFRPAPRGTDRDLPIHLDFEVEDREAAIDRFRDFGATVRETKSDPEHGTVWTVMEDPAGNGFCVTDSTA